MKYILILNFLFLSSCGLLKTKSLNRNITKASQSVCLSSEGKGRLEILKRKYVFSYESALDVEAANWELALSFPLRDQESFKLDWSEENKILFTSSIEDKILKENKNINPNSLHEFTQNLGRLLHEVILRSDEANKGLKSKFMWQVTNKELKAMNRDKTFKASFLNLVAGGHFGLMRIQYKDDDQQSYKLDLVVRNCHEK
jgi:hypothetical protein